VRNVRSSVAVGVGCLVLVGASSVFAQDWPQWRGPNRDGVATGFTAPAAWPAALTQGWRTSVGTGDATPALVGDKLYVFTRQGDDEVTTCLNASDSQQVWQDKYAAQAVTGAASRHPGPRSAPAVADGKVVTLGVAGVVSCLEAATGKLLWRKDLFPGVVPKFFTSSSPLIVDGTAIAQLGGQGSGAIVAFDLATGDTKWQWAGDAPQYASPVLLTVGGTTQVVTLTEASVVGLNVADGKLLWQLPFVPEGRAYNSATPIVDGQTVIYTGAGRGTKAVQIKQQGDGFAAKELWSNPDLASQFSTPVLANGFLFGLSNRGNPFCLNAKTGQTAWTSDALFDRGSFGPIVNAGSVLLTLPSSSELIAFAASDKQYTELTRIKVADTPTYAFPVLAGNRVFVKDQDAVTLWTLP